MAALKETVPLVPFFLEGEREREKRVREKEQETGE